MHVHALLEDSHYAFRHVRRSPVFALVAIGTLAIAIGANAALFSMLNALAIARLPIPDADGLVAVMPLNARNQPRSTPVSAVDELIRSGPLDHPCGYLGGVVLPIMANGVPVQTLTTFVTGQCFDAFRIQPALGRLIGEADAPTQSAGSRVAVISHRLWETRFQRNPGVLGTSLLVNNVDVTVIGVLPRGFVGLEVDNGIDVFTPFDAVLIATPGSRQLAGVILGRLKAGTSLSEAASQLRTMWPEILKVAVPESLAASERSNLRDSIPQLTRVGTGLSPNRQKYARPLTLIMGLSATLLLIACLNLGGLLLSRWAAREGEITIRLALGASLVRVTRQMVFESLFLSLAGAALAIPLAYAIPIALMSLLPPVNVPYTMSFAPDVTVLLVTSGVGVLVGIAISLLPLALLRRRRDGAPTSQRTIAAAGGWWRRGLITAQVALSVIILSGAALLARSVYLLGHSDLGVREGVLNVKLFPLPNVPEKRAERGVYYPALLERISAVPGVRSAALAMNFPRLTLPPMTMVSLIETPANAIASGVDRVSPAFFYTMDIPLLAGRPFAWSDTLQSRPVAIVSERLARMLSSDTNVIDRHIKVGSAAADQDITIVGVVANATQGNPREADGPVLYRPALQLGVESAFSPNLLIDAADIATASAMAAQIVRESGRDYIQETITVDKVLARAPASERMSAAVATIVAVLAALMTAVGVYSTLAYSVGRRSREIGLRVAVGASPGHIALLVIREGFAFALIGVVVGYPIALAATRPMRSLLFGVTESDPATFAGVGVFFLVVGIIGALVPARRALAVDPVKALIAE